MSNRNVANDDRKRDADAVRTSLGVRGKLSVTRKASPSFSGGKSPSNAGLNNAKSAWIQPHGSGYSTQRKHGAKLPSDLRTNFGSIGGSRPASSGMVNYVRGSSGNSSLSRLASKQKFDRMF